MDEMLSKLSIGEEDKNKLLAAMKEIMEAKELEKEAAVRAVLEATELEKQAAVKAAVEAKELENEAALKAAVKAAVEAKEQENEAAVMAARALGQLEGEMWGCIQQALLLISERNTYNRLRGTRCGDECRRIRLW